MSRKKLALLLFGLWLTACGPAEDGPPGSSSISQAPESSSHTASAPEEAKILSETEELPAAEPAAGAYEPAEWSGWQEDPTAGERYFDGWDHVEFRLFGDPQSYLRQEKECSPFDREGNFLEGETLTVEYLLPSGCVDDSVINMDLGFEKGPMKIGELPSHYYSLEAGEDPYRIGEGNFARGNLVGIWGSRAEEAETRDNIPGGIYETDKFLRGVCEAFGSNHQVTYYIRLDEARLMYLCFYVSRQAAAEDLALYDAIAASVRVKPG